MGQITSLMQGAIIPLSQTQQGFLREPLQKQLQRQIFQNFDIGANVGVYTLVFCNQAQNMFCD